MAKCTQTNRSQSTYERNVHVWDSIILIHLLTRSGKIKNRCKSLVVEGFGCLKIPTKVRISALCWCTYIGLRSIPIGIVQHMIIVVMEGIMTKLLRANVKAVRNWRIAMKCRKVMIDYFFVIVNVNAHLKFIGKYFPVWWAVRWYEYDNDEKNNLRSESVMRLYVLVIFFRFQRYFFEFLGVKFVQNDFQLFFLFFKNKIIFEKAFYNGIFNKLKCSKKLFRNKTGNWKPKPKL